MSYFDSLSSWQQAGQQIQNQQQESEQENRNKKAQTIGDKFDMVDKVLGESAGGLGGLGGGFHIGVRMYRKGQKRVADAKKAFEDAKKKLNGGGQKPETDGQGSKTPDEHTSQPNGQEDQPPEPKGKGKAKANEESNETADQPADPAPKADGSDGDSGGGGESGESTAPPAGSDELKQQQTPKGEGDSDLADQHGYADQVIKNNEEVKDNIFSSDADKRIAQSKIDAQEDFKANNPLPDNAPAPTGAPADAPPPAQAPAEGPKPSEQVKDAPEPPPKDTDFPEAPKPPEPPKPLGEEPDLLPKPGESGLNSGATEMPSADGGIRMGQQSSGESVVKDPSTTASTEGASSEITTSGADETGNVVANLTERAGSTFDKVKGTVGNAMDKVSDLKQTVTDGAGDMLKAGVEKVAGQAGKDALESASGVLDFLGPIGELLGAGLALGSFFHDLFDKKKNEKKQQQAEDAPSGAVVQSGGISTTSMAVANQKSNIVGTLV